MVVFLFDLILLLIITVCQIITLVERSKRKINDNHYAKTVLPPKFTALSIKQRQEVRKIQSYVVDNLNILMIKKFPGKI